MVKQLLKFQQDFEDLFLVSVEKVGCLSHVHVWKQKLIPIVLFG